MRFVAPARSSALTVMKARIVLNQDTLAKVQSLNQIIHSSLEIERLKPSHSISTEVLNPEACKSLHQGEQTLCPL